jgi:hypothetical protein
MCSVVSVGRACKKCPAKRFSLDLAEKKFGRDLDILDFCHFNTNDSNTNMGNAKKEASRKTREGKTGDGMGNVKTKGENFYRYGFAQKRDIWWC